MPDPQPTPLPNFVPSILDLEASERWELRISTSLTAIAPRPEANRIINPITFTEIITSPTIAIQAVTQTFGIKYIGRLFQLANVNLENISSAMLGFRHVYAGTKLIIFRQEVINSYRLRLEPSSQVMDLVFRVFQYNVD